MQQTTTTITWNPATLNSNSATRYTPIDPTRLLDLDSSPLHHDRLAPHATIHLSISPVHSSKPQLLTTCPTPIPGPVASDPTSPAAPPLSTNKRVGLPAIAALLYHPTGREEEDPSGQRANLPRSTSVKYKNEAQSASHRRLAVPPNTRRGGSKPHRKSVRRHAAPI